MGAIGSGNPIANCYWNTETLLCYLDGLRNRGDLKS